MPSFAFSPREAIRPVCSHDDISATPATRYRTARQEATPRVSPGVLSDIIGILGAVRSPRLAGRDPYDPGRRVIAPVKQNLCEPTPSR